MLPTTLLTLALGVLASTATAAKPWPKTNIDLTATLTKLAADPTDKDARFGITRNVRAEDFPVEGLDLTKATTLGFHLAGIEDQIMEEITDAADKEKLLKFYRAAHADKAAKLDGMTCTAEQWGKLMQAYDDALYMAEKASPKVVASNKLYVYRNCGVLLILSGGVLSAGENTGLTYGAVSASSSARTSQRTSQLTKSTLLTSRRSSTTLPATRSNSPLCAPPRPTRARFARAEILRSRWAIPSIGAMDSGPPSPAPKASPELRQPPKPLSARPDLR